jgi:hypothetical protein
MYVDNVLPLTHCFLPTPPLAGFPIASLSDSCPVVSDLHFAYERKYVISDFLSLAYFA